MSLLRRRSGCRRKAAWEKRGIVKLNANENPYGPPPRVREVIAAFDAAQIYPDPDHATLRACLSQHTGFAAERIIAGRAVMS